MILLSSSALRIGGVLRRGPIRCSYAKIQSYKAIDPTVTRLVVRSNSSSYRYSTNCSSSINITRTSSSLYAQRTSSSSSPRQKKKASLTYSDILQFEDGTLKPSTFHNTNGSIPSPRALSPSAAAEFKACPQSYLLQYLYGIRQPTTLALAKGRVCHSALEQLFDLEPHQRSLEHLQNLFRKNWSMERMTDEYRHLFDIEFETETAIESNDDDNGTEPIRDIEKERLWGEESLQLLKQYYELEDPRLVPRPNPIEREIWVQSKLSMDPSRGVTGTNYNGGMNMINGDDDDEYSDSSIEDPVPGESFLVRGIVDRLDYVAIPPSPRRTFLEKSENINVNGSNMNDNNEPSHQSCVRIVDYKTGKAPEFKYSPATNFRIASDNMWQLKIYALLLREMIAAQKTKSKGGNLKSIAVDEIRLLRLMYLTSVDGQAQYLDLDLGETEEERNETLNVVHGELADIWEAIQRLVKNGDPSAFHHCDRSFCVCHKIRPKFEDGSLQP